MRGIFVLLLCGMAAGLAYGQGAVEIAGDWLGTLTVPGGALRVVFHIKQTAAGAFSATLDSPDQSALGIPVNSVTLQGNTLTINVETITGSFAGTVSVKGKEIVGNWTQGSSVFPLTLKRGSVAAPRRPQEPKPPYPYAVQAVSYAGGATKITLAGTLTYPHGKGPFPAVLLIAGSGPQSRDEMVAGHRVFLVLADYLTRRGIAVLRVDKRGIGASTGDFATTTSEDFAADARAGVAFLKKQKLIDAKHIGLIGHSEGGIIAPMVAADTIDVAFIVLMAGTGIPGDQLLALQSTLIMRAEGGSEQEITDNRATQEQIFTIARQEKDAKKAAEQIRAVVRKAIDSMSPDKRKLIGDADAYSEMQASAMLSPWMRFFLTYDPVPMLRKVQCPVLALNGSLDLQVPPKENLPPIRTALVASGNKDVTVTELPHLNHLFQTATTGSPREYATIEETMAPAALKAIGDWVVGHTKK